MIAALLIGGAVPTVLRDWSDFTFNDFKRVYGRVYETSALESKKAAAFAENMETVLRQNRDYQAGASSWWASINSFSDLSEAEFSAKKKGLKPHHQTHAFTTLAPPVEVATPWDVDWREKKSPGGSAVVTPVKDQGMCGSCWAFASTATIESYYALATDELAVLAPQTLVNCAPNPDDCGGTGGCEGSIPELAFNYTRSGGIALETDLPYKAHDENCTAFKAKATLDGYVKLPANSADALETALATVGPIAVNVAANWQHYAGGIFSGGCLPTKSCVLDHVVVATGYHKSDAPDQGYWLIRNSWGTGWGEEGYIRLTRGFDSTAFVDKTPASGVACKPFPKMQRVMGESGVLLDMSYPTGVRRAE